MKKFISILLVLALAVSLFAGFALADSISPYVVFSTKTIAFPLEPVSDGDYVYPVNYLRSTSSYTGSAYLAILAFQSSVSSGSLDSYLGLFPVFSSGYVHVITFYDSSGVLLDSFVDQTGPLPSSTRFICFSVNVDRLTDEQLARPWPISPSSLVFSDLVFDSSGSGSGSGSDSDPSLDQDILSAVESIAQSLLDLETGPYSGVTNITPNYDANGNFTDNTLTVSNNATLNGLLNALGISSTSSALYLKNLYDNWGNNFTYYLMDTPVTGGNLATEMVESVKYDLPTYIATFGQDLSYAVQQMRRENYAEQQTWTQRYQWLYDRVDTLDSTLSTDINHALYAETDTSPSETWSIAQWAKGIYNSITGFFSSFWSPAETSIKEDNEAAMEAVTTNGVHTTAQNVNDFASMQSAVTGFLPAGDISGFNPLNDTAFYSFWSEQTHKAMLPPNEETESVPSTSRRLLSASPPSSAPVVDYGAYERNQSLYQSLLGGGLTDSR